MNEVYLALVGGHVGCFWWGMGHSPSEGEPCSVRFDHQFVMDREEKHGDVVGFYHTHPNFTNEPSSIDYCTMGAWTVCFGKKLACCIEGSNGLDAHWFEDDESRHVTKKVWRFGKNFFVGML